MERWEDVQRRVERVKWFASWMDDKFALPGTRIRFGLDSLLGLLPGVGDLATGAAGLWLVVEGWRLRLPFSVLVQMIINLIIDMAGGAIPIVGDLFDVYWKSNRRNADLLQRWLEKRLADTDMVESE